MPLVCFVVNIW